MVLVLGSACVAPWGGGESLCVSFPEMEVHIKHSSAARILHGLHRLSSAKAASIPKHRILTITGGITDRQKKSGSMVPRTRSHRGVIASDVGLLSGWKGTVSAKFQILTRQPHTDWEERVHEYESVCQS